MSQFTEEFPSLESYWRSVVLFGKNTASYKFALAKSLLQLVSPEITRISLEDLAVPFAKNITEHLKTSDKQGTFKNSRFLEAARQFNRGELNEQELQTTTVSLGFNNVLDAFHMVNQSEIPVRFFDKDFQGRNKGIVVTDSLMKLKETVQFGNFSAEIEARWRLVETAWALGMSRDVIQIAVDPEDEHSERLITMGRRSDVTSTRDALNGYQKGKCFYCFDDISIDSGSENLAEVDHFFPRALRRARVSSIQLNGVWNLVLAGHHCNNWSNKSARIPDNSYLERLNKRNNFLIDSHHPLRETLILQTGNTATDRHNFLREMDGTAINNLIHRWKANFEHEPAF